MQLNSVRMINRFAPLLLVAALIACDPSANRIKNDNSSDVYLQLGVRYLEMDKLELAKANLLLALKYKSDNAQAYNVMAFLDEKLNQYDQAKKHYETALGLAPEDLGVKNNFGRFLCERGDFEAGMALLSQVSANPLNDKQWMALTNAGRCLLGMKKKQQAESNFKQALQLDKNYAPALSEMQIMAYQNGDFWAAKGYLQRYLGLAPHTPETLWYAAQVELALGNKALANEYKNLLLEKFPLSPEAKKSIGAKEVLTPNNTLKKYGK